MRLNSKFPPHHSINMARRQREAGLVERHLFTFVNAVVDGQRRHGHGFAGKWNRGALSRAHRLRDDPSQRKHVSDDNQVCHELTTVCCYGICKKTDVRQSAK